MKKIDFDEASIFIKKFTDILIFQNPIGTSVGAFGGIFFYTLVHALAPFFEIVKILKDIGISIYLYMCSGIFLGNFNKFRNQHKIPDSIDESIKFIDIQVKQGRITKAQAKIHYNSIVQKVVQDITLDEKTQRKLERLPD